MPDAIFSLPRLAGVYDALESDRSDLDTYLDLAAEGRVNAVLDVGTEGLVEDWVEVTKVDRELVTFESPTIFHSDGGRLDSTSTLRFRTQGALRSTLAEAGFGAVEIRDLPYAPTRGWLVLATA
ncbi:MULTISPECIES: hypothetical protein [Arthrobacter]|uniref:hypothetical protein n=1 Tax=Arthrobacter TaxID=1663 RepID=UPI001D14E7DC|nr:MULTISPECIES: hypothetical protein [Arthrobacter]MCC3282391.1 hypothetical protein [Arthrobacter caoxuetaonis]MCC9194111.1 hypothetical protein [Arthrobacter sp. zg-Y916]